MEPYQSIQMEMIFEFQIQIQTEWQPQKKEIILENIPESIQGIYQSFFLDLEVKLRKSRIWLKLRRISILELVIWVSILIRIQTKMEIQI